MARSDTFHADGVRRLYEVTRRVIGSTDLAEVLEEIAQGVVEGLGYGVAAIARLEGDTLVMTACAGPEDVREQIIGRRTPASLILEEFRMADHWGILRFLPHERLPSETVESLWVPSLSVSPDPEAWHPLDTLYAPLYSSNGELLGNMAVDLPPGNKVPDQQGRELLEMFVVQAGLALEHAQRREQLSRQVRLGEALKTLAFSVHRDLDDGLRGAAQALSEALDSPQVTVRCFADNAADPIESSAGFPDDPRAPAGTVEAIRSALTRRAGEGLVRPYTIAAMPEPGEEGDAAVDVVRPHLAAHHWGGCLLAPIGVDREVLGYLVVLRRPDQSPFEEEELDAVHEAGRELGRLVRDARLRRTELRLVSELRELDRYKGELIATISHELKTPLTSIMGHTELLADAGVQPTSVDAIARNAARLDRLVTNLLNYSRIQSRREIERVPVDLAELCRAAAEMLRVQADGAGVEIRLELPEAPVVVLGDREDLPKVVDNLCSNAVKYTQRGGQVTILVHADDGAARVVVSDTGLGISRQDQVHLFSAFHRSTNPDALTIPGTGLGLAISRTIAEAHGGTIEVESDLGKGSTFVLTVPLAGE
ncbi:sensor histidine kinase [Nocardioides euryhalodurans]|uniref:histidine kinase n=1 Tax=Nocardioides euryhalodurans TaxID=2518370 RepID=A0A4P7GI22_9ACTN|nr:HAMP domain-containing sensor histidine kinase [Nocardioides euryhalodurans]QBR91453.1 HAMP domain-containing histidine kinase [Nocardioides euryhalodurans]